MHIEVSRDIVENAAAEKGNARVLNFEIKISIKENDNWLPLIIQSGIFGVQSR